MQDTDIHAGGALGPDAEFRAALERGEFLVQQCGGCHRSVFYPRLLCPFCGSKALRAIASSLRGVVYASTTVRQRPDAGGDYNIALIDLEEGPRLMSRVTGVPSHDVRIGESVRGRVVKEDGAAIVIFERA